MNAREIMNEAFKHGISLGLNGGKLTLKAKAKPPDRLLARIKAHKANIVAILEKEPGPSASSVPPLKDQGDHCATRGMAYLAAFWKELTPLEKQGLGRSRLDAWKRAAKEADAALLRTPTHRQGATCGGLDR